MFYLLAEKIWNNINDEEFEKDNEELNANCIFDDDNSKDIGRRSMAF